MTWGFWRSLPGQLLLLVVLGLVAGAVWAQVARPAQWLVSDGRLELTINASRDTFGVLLVFVAVGAVTALVWAMLATVLLGTSWQQVVTVLIGSLVLAVICWRVGLLLGPPDPSSAAAGLSDGDMVDDRLSVQGFAPFLVWPIAGLIGMLLVTWPAAIRDRKAQQGQRATDATTA